MTPRRIAILGGGLGGLAAAYSASERDPTAVRSSPAVRRSLAKAWAIPPVARIPQRSPVIPRAYRPRTPFGQRGPVSLAQAPEQSVDFPM